MRTLFNAWLMVAIPVFVLGLLLLVVSLLVDDKGIIHDENRKMKERLLARCVLASPLLAAAWPLLMLAVLAVLGRRAGRILLTMARYRPAQPEQSVKQGPYR